MNYVAVGRCSLQENQLTKKRLLLILFPVIECVMSAINVFLGARNVYIDPGKGLFVYYVL